MEGGILRAEWSLCWISGTSGLCASFGALPATDNGKGHKVSPWDWNHGLGHFNCKLQLSFTLGDPHHSLVKQI